MHKWPKERELTHLAVAEQAVPYEWYLPVETNTDSEVILLHRQYG